MCDKARERENIEVRGGVKNIKRERKRKRETHIVVRESQRYRKR